MAAVRHLTTDEAAARLGVEPETLRKWRQLGCGPAYIKGDRGGRSAVIRYRERDLLAWEESRLVKPPTP